MVNTKGAAVLSRDGVGIASGMANDAATFPSFPEGAAVPKAGPASIHGPDGGPFAVVEAGPEVGGHGNPQTPGFERVEARPSAAAERRRPAEPLR